MTTKLEKINRFFKIYFNKALIIVGFLMIFFGLTYNILIGSFSMGEKVLIIVGMCCLLFGYFFRIIRSEWEKMGKDIREKAGHEAMEEKKREIEFDTNHSRISQVIGVGWIIKWMYKEGWWYSGGLILLVFLGFFIRITNLTILYPYTDEYSHLIAAKTLIENGTTDYTRAYFLTYIVYKLFTFFEPSLFIARLPGVIFGALAAIPIYLMVRKISKKSGFISALLWITSPWAIMASRNVREYAIFPFFMVIFLIILIYYMQRILQIIMGNTKISWKEIVLTIIVIIPFVYAFIIDPSSSFKQIALFLPPIALYFIYRILMIKDINIKYRILLLMTIVIGIVTAILYMYINKYFINFNPTFNPYYLTMLFGDTPGFQQYLFYDSFGAIYQYYLRYFLLRFILLAGILYIFIKKEDIGIILSLVFLFEIYYLTFHFDRYIKPRYGFFILPLFLSIVGIGIYAIYNVISNWKFNQGAKKCVYVLVFMLLLFIFNPFSTYMAITYDKQLEVPWSREYHDDIGPLMDTFKNEINNSDIIIASNKNLVRWYFNISINSQNIYKYDYLNPNRFLEINKIVTEHDKGWIVLDSRRNSFRQGLSKDDFETGGKKVYFLGYFGNFLVYEWGSLSNLVRNPSFERGTSIPMKWTFVSQNGNTPIWDNVSHRGSKSVKISVNGTIDLNSGFPRSDIITVQPLTKYTISAWGKTEGANGTNRPTVRVVELDSSNKWIRQTNLPEFSRNSNNWTQKTMEIQTGLNTSYVYIYANIWNGYGTFWIDDIELILKNTSTPTPIPNESSTVLQTPIQEPIYQ